MPHIWIMSVYMLVLANANLFLKDELEPERAKRYFSWSIVHNLLAPNISSSEHMMKLILLVPLLLIHYTLSSL